MIDEKVYIPGLELRSLNRDLRGTSMSTDAWVSFVGCTGLLAFLAIYVWELRR